MQDKSGDLVLLAFTICNQAHRSRLHELGAHQRAVPMTLLFERTRCIELADQPERLLFARALQANRFNHYVLERTSRRNQSRRLCVHIWFRNHSKTPTYVDYMMSGGWELEFPHRR